MANPLDKIKPRVRELKAYTLKPDRGTVKVGGIELAKLAGRELTEARRMFGMVFQG